MITINAKTGKEIWNTEAADPKQGYAFTHAPLVVEDKVIVELKSAANFDAVHSKQVLTYLKVTNLRVALLLNFGVASLGNTGIKRFQI